MKKVLILSGERGQGKSTWLKEIFGEIPDADGIITLRREGDDRDFYRLSSGECWPMQGDANYEGPWLEVGRFRFSAEAFGRACSILLEIGLNPDLKLLVIDEIGPLELRGEGFSEILKKLIAASEGPDILVVVRTELVQEVRQYFGLEQAKAEAFESLMSGM